MSTTKTGFSVRGLNEGSAIDVAALSDVAKRTAPDVRAVVITTAAGQTATAVFTQNTTVKHALGPVGIDALLVAASVSVSQVPAGGTLSFQLVAYDASGNAEIVLSDVFDAESLTVREGGNFVLATTNVALAKEDTLELHCIASNDAIGTVAQGVRVACVWEPTETTVAR